MLNARRGERGVVAMTFLLFLAVIILPASYAAWHFYAAADRKQKREDIKTTVAMMAGYEVLGGVGRDEEIAARITRNGRLMLASAGFSRLPFAAGALTVAQGSNYLPLDFGGRLRHVSVHETRAWLFTPDGRKLPDALTRLFKTQIGQWTSSEPCTIARDVPMGPGLSPLPPPGENRFYVYPTTDDSWDGLSHGYERQAVIACSGRPYMRGDGRECFYSQDPVAGRERQWGSVLYIGPQLCTELGRYLGFGDINVPAGRYLLVRYGHPAVLPESFIPPPPDPLPPVSPPDGDDAVPDLSASRDENVHVAMVSRGEAIAQGWRPHEGLGYGVDSIQDPVAGVVDLTGRLTAYHDSDIAWLPGPIASLARGAMDVQQVPGQMVSIGGQSYYLLGTDDARPVLSATVAVNTALQLGVGLLTGGTSLVPGIATRGTGMLAGYAFRSAAKPLEHALVLSVAKGITRKEAPELVLTSWQRSDRLLEEETIREIKNPTIPTPMTETRARFVAQPAEARPIAIAQTEHGGVAAGLPSETPKPTLVMVQGAPFIKAPAPGVIDAPAISITRSPLGKWGKEISAPVAKAPVQGVQDATLGAIRLLFGQRAYYRAYRMAATASSMLGAH